ncbi:hypothetical protein [Shewanella violacea]|uniref:Structural protein P5 n=1 Tax=Shewanella violacea (strain JCM 10179 / CIP 106290 / LMG 19151 / DSS12) TaxID=637905 RepID=D4ZKF4_SHEVD|nr:hypothetical protein [Shewanella violacea]BAJ02153.1 conserved hypothetical protein [Shewanella violacea DSS12]
MINLRLLTVMGVGGAVAVIAAYRFKSPKNNNDQSINDSARLNLEYLNFDFTSLFFGTDNASAKDTNSVRKPKGLANNNPLNLEAGRDQWQGMKGNDGRFIIFESAFWGIRAAARTLKTYRDKRGLNNVQDIVTRWAPPSDNNPTDKYISFVAKQAGVLASQPLGVADYPRVIAAMIHFENGYNPYEASIVAAATAEGFA